MVMIESNKTELKIKLKDGRTLCYAEYGDPEGKPIIHFNGFPGSRLEPMLILNKIKDKGVRFIGVDRPGLGLSDFKKGRTLLDWPDDVIELADALGFDKFAVVGVSGGGPFSIACAYKIPDRLTGCGVIGGLGPQHLSTEGMLERSRRQKFIFNWFPWLIRLLWWAKGRKMKNPEKAKNDILNQLENFPESDQKVVSNPEIISILAKEMSEAFRQGTKGIYHEFMMLWKHWGFNLEDISPKIKVIVWHGELDVNVPISMGRGVADLIPNSDGRFFPEDGHYSVVFNNFEDVINTLKNL